MKTWMTILATTAALLLAGKVMGAAQYTCYVSWSKEIGGAVSQAKTYEGKIGDRDTTQAAEVRVQARYLEHNAFAEAVCRE